MSLTIEAPSDAMATVDIRPLSPVLAAEVIGLDLRQDRWMRRRAGRSTTRSCATMCCASAISR